MCLAASPGIISPSHSRDKNSFTSSHCMHPPSLRPAPTPIFFSVHLSPWLAATPPFPLVRSKPRRFRRRSSPQLLAATSESASLLTNAGMHLPLEKRTLRYIRKTHLVQVNSRELVSSTTLKRVFSLRRKCRRGASHASGHNRSGVAKSA